MTQKELGETTRPRELVAGGPDSVRTTASRLLSRADRIDDVCTRLRRLDLTGVWEGEAATSFLNAVAELQPHFDFAAEADREAAKALDVYARVLEDAQTDAGRAIEVWEHGQHATRAAERDQAIAVFGASGGLVFDPGEAQRANARRILLLAREDVADAGNRAASALHDSQSVHASSAGFWDVVGGTVGNFLGDLGNSAASLLNAMVQHPDEYWSAVMGLLSMEGGAAAFAGGVGLDATGAGALAGVAVNVAAGGLVVAGAGVASTSMTKLLQQAAGEDRVEPFKNEAAGAGNSSGYPGSNFEEESVLADAGGGSGNFGLGSGTTAQATKAGEAWVGDGYRVASDGKTLVSRDGLRAWRPPSFKPKLGIWQANFEQRPVPNGRWESNGHLDISDKL